MFAREMRSWILAAAMTAMAAPAFAQGPPGGGPPPMDRASVEQRMALDAPGLNLTAAQKSQIDKLVDDYIAGMGKMRAQMTPGTPPSQEMMTSMRTSRENLNAAIGKVMNDAQRKTWEAALAARPQMGPGMGGPGMGGPPPAR